MSELEKLKIKAKLLQKAKRRAGVDFRLKDAFEMLARKAGFLSWRDLRENLDETAEFCPAGSSAFWKVWYSNYEEARAHLNASGGFLLPYRKHFFLCEAVYVHFLGVPEGDADLAAVGVNWAEPKDVAAYRRVLEKIRARA